MKDKPLTANQVQTLQWFVGLKDFAHPASAGMARSCDSLEARKLMDGDLRLHVVKHQAGRTFKNYKRAYRINAAGKAALRAAKKLQEET